MLSIDEKLEFGTEVILLKKRYKLSEDKLSKLIDTYGHCLSINQYLELEYDEDYSKGIELYIDDLIVFDETYVKAVIIGINKHFGYYAKAHEKWMIGTQTIKLNEYDGKTFLISDVGKEFQDVIFDGDIHVHSLNENISFEDGFQVIKKDNQ